jgi:hypothetical protein
MATYCVIYVREKAELSHYNHIVMRTDGLIILLITAHRKVLLEGLGGPHTLSKRMHTHTEREGVVVAASPHRRGHGLAGAEDFLQDRVWAMHYVTACAVSPT